MPRRPLSRLLHPHMTPWSLSRARIPGYSGDAANKGALHMAKSGSILGNPVLRLEDPTLLRGTGKYSDDLDVPGVAHVVFVRSSIAHGRITSLDVSGAVGMPGVVAVYSGDDLGLASFQGFAMMPAVINRPVFASDVVRFVGDIVAAVV